MPDIRSILTPIVYVEKIILSENLDGFNTCDVNVMRTLPWNYAAKQKPGQ